MRIYKEIDLTKIKTIIENRVNNVFNRNIGTTPIELVYKKHDFNLFDLPLIKLKLKKTRRLSKKYNINFGKNDYVFIKNINPLKTDKRWVGPYKVYDIDKNEKRFKARKRNKFLWLGVKLVKLYRRAGCGVTTF